MSCASPVLSSICEEFDFSIRETADTIDVVDTSHITDSQEIFEAWELGDMRIPVNAEHSEFFVKNWHRFCGLANIDRRALRKLAAKRRPELSSA